MRVHLLLWIACCVVQGAVKYCVQDKYVDYGQKGNTIYGVVNHPVESNIFYVTTSWNASLYDTKGGQLNIIQTARNYAYVAAWTPDGLNIIGSSEDKNNGQTYLFVMTRNDISQWFNRWYNRDKLAANDYDWVQQIAIDPKTDLTYTLTGQTYTLAIHNTSNLNNIFLISEVRLTDLDNAITPTLGYLATMVFNGNKTLFISGGNRFMAYDIPSKTLTSEPASYSDMAISDDGAYLFTWLNNILIRSGIDGSVLSQVDADYMAKGIFKTKDYLLLGFNLESQQTTQLEINLKNPKVPTIQGPVPMGGPVIPNSRVAAWFFTNGPQDVILTIYKAANGTDTTVDKLFVAYPCGDFSTSSGNSGNSTEISQNFQSSGSNGNLNATLIGAILGSIVGLGIFCGISAIFLYAFLRRRNLKYTLREEPVQVEFQVESVFQVEKFETEVKRAALLNPWTINFQEIQLGKVLGSGVSGLVTKATWRGADVVVKTLHSVESQNMDNFLKEAAHMIELRRHPNVCGFLGIVWEPDQPLMIVTEFMAQGSLWDLINDGTIPIDMQMVMGFTIDAASGMSHIHAENILHCDLATRNLLIRRTGDQFTLKIADFGMAHQTQSDDYNPKAHTNFAIRWCSPELLKYHIFTKASDVWAFGIAMWEMVEQKRPYFHISSNQAAFDYIVEGGKPKRPSKFAIGDGFWNVMKGCWAEDPEDRPPFQKIVSDLIAIKDSDELKDPIEVPVTPVVPTTAIAFDRTTYHLTSARSSEWEEESSSDEDIS